LDSEGILDVAKPRPRYVGATQRAISLNIPAGIIFCTLAVLIGVFKYTVVRDDARGMGGDVPVLDFVFFPPFLLSIGLSLVLKHYGLYPFPYFGVAPMSSWRACCSAS
jgi:hypothetical protein